MTVSLPRHNTSPELHQRAHTADVFSCLRSYRVQGDEVYAATALVQVRLALEERAENAMRLLAGRAAGAVQYYHLVEWLRMVVPRLSRWALGAGSHGVH